VTYIWNNSCLNCGCRWKWRMIIAVNSQRWSFFPSGPVCVKDRTVAFLHRCALFSFPVPLHVSALLHNVTSVQKLIKHKLVGITKQNDSKDEVHC